MTDGRTDGRTDGPTDGPTTRLLELLRAAKNCDNSKTQLVTKLKETQIATKIKNLNCDKTQNLKWCQN